MNAGVHGDGNGLEVLKTITPEDGVDVQVLQEVNGMMLSVTFDLDAKQPVEFIQIGHVYMLRDPGLEISNQGD